jgi:hypothetical protein
MSGEELAVVRGGTIVREGKECNQAGWWPCQGSGSCYWSPPSQDCRYDSPRPVPACQGGVDEDHECRVYEDPPFACCLMVISCTGNSPENCGEPFVFLNQAGCDYRRCQTFYQGQPHY